MGIWHASIIDEYVFCTLVIMCVFCVFSCYLSLSFAMITYSVGVDEVAGLEVPLEDEEVSVKVIEDLGAFSSGQFVLGLV